MAAISLLIREDTREVERMLKHYRGGASKVITRALNKTIKPVERVAVRNMAEDLRITQKSVRKAIRLRRATWSNLRAEVQVTGRRLPVSAFAAKQTKPGVTYRGKGSGRKLITGAFITTLRSGHVGVFKRLSKKRLPIQELFGPSIPHVFIQSHIQRVMDTEADSIWRKNLDHELKWFIKNA
ncbi:hypothetical protein DJ031_04655 [bacterium endosymbiont of Escarpia laminata]|nr:MAG: hypothetical protein DJ031_04655 [bacterium endosymbiont of Escarpia laminata]